MGDTPRMQKHTILLSAGGTGGHIFPAEALARDLLSRGFEVAMTTDIRGERYIPFDRNEVEVHVLKSGTVRKGLVSTITSVMNMGLGYVQAHHIIKRVKPVVVVGFGGYPSFPAVYAAQKRKIPTVIHESNAILGKANEYLAPKADRIALGFPDISGLDESDVVRTVVTGTPVHPDIAELYNKPYPTIEQDGELRIFIMGGSQGAKVFGDVLPLAFSHLPEAQRKRLKITQQCRKEDIEDVTTAYKDSGIKAELKPFYDDVPKRLADAHLFIGRSGSATVSEVTAAGRPAIFVPYPFHKDQELKRNAELVADMGGAWVMTQEGFTAEALLTRIETSLQSPEILFLAAEKARASGRPDAARKLGNVVTAIAQGWDKDKLKPYDLTQGRIES